MTERTPRKAFSGRSSDNRALCQGAALAPKERVRHGCAVLHNEIVIYAGRVLCTLGISAAVRSSG